MHSEGGAVQVPKIVVIVLNWNKLGITKACLLSLVTLSYPNYRICLVDNGSSEHGVENLAGLVPNLSLLCNTANLGYAGGNNVAMAQAFAEGANYVWLLNNDAIVESETLHSLVQLAESDPTIGLVSPILRRTAKRGDVEAAGAIFDLGGYSLSVTCSENQAETWQRDKPDRIAVFGTALLIKKALYDAIGGFDDRFFAYNEDVDLSIRSTMAGFRNVIDFASSVYHRERPREGAGLGSVAPYIKYYMTRNEILLWSKHCGAKARLKVSIWELSRRLVEIAGEPTETNDPAQVDAMLAGLWDGCRLSGGPYSPDRRMPTILRRLLLANPSFWVAVVGRLTGSPLQAKT